MPRKGRGSKSKRSRPKAGGGGAAAGPSSAQNPTASGYASANFAFEYRLFFVFRSSIAFLPHILQILVLGSYWQCSGSRGSLGLSKQAWCLGAFLFFSFWSLALSGVCLGLFYSDTLLAFCLGFSIMADRGAHARC
jgi:hypothetical protein